MEIKGNIPALVTPFTKENEVDEEGLRNNIEHLIKDVHGLVPCGTTGESPTLSHEEHKRVIEITVESANGRVPVIAGTGSNNTDEAVELTRHAEDVGADAALLIAPYYNKPTQEGIIEHYRKIAVSVNIPLIIYNIPGRTSINITPETLCELSKQENIVGVKEASGDLGQMMKIRSLCGLTLLSGDDNLTLPLLSIGGIGVISVASNIVPKEVSAMVAAFEKGDLKKAREVHYSLMPLFKALFIETNPAPIKEAMNLLGLSAGHVRLPLVNVKESTREELRRVLKDLGKL